MKKKVVKLNLKELKIQSFVTSQKKEIQGGLNTWTMPVPGICEVSESMCGDC